VQEKQTHEEDSKFSRKTREAFLEGTEKAKEAFEEILQENKGLQKVSEVEAVEVLRSENADLYERVSILEEKLARGRGRPSNYLPPEDAHILWDLRVEHHRDRFQDLVKELLKRQASVRSMIIKYPESNEFV
jgi:hypothetical protein